MARRDKNKSNNKTKGLSIVVAVVLLISLAIGGMIAYFTGTDSETNRFTMGDNIEIEVTEVWDENDGIGLRPEMVVTKEPSIRNKSATTPAYVFMKVEVPCYASGGTASPVADTPLFTYEVNSGWALINRPEVDTTSKTITYVYAYGTLANMTTLAAGATTTTPIFSEVTVAPTLTADQCATANANSGIEINGYGIQIDNLKVAKPSYIFKLFGTGIETSKMGDKVNYSVTVNEGEENEVTLNDWEVFLEDDGNIYMIYGDYLPNAAIPDAALAGFTPLGEYRVQPKGRAILVRLADSENWLEYITSELETAATTAGGEAFATGGPTVGQFKQSYNSVYPNTCTVSGDETVGWNSQNLRSTTGYSVEESNNLYWSRKSATGDGTGRFRIIARILVCVTCCRIICLGNLVNSSRLDKVRGL